jgi:hypothetical protein
MAIVYLGKSRLPNMDSMLAETIGPKVIRLESVEPLATGLNTTRVIALSHPLTELGNALCVGRMKTGMEWLHRQIADIFGAEIGDKVIVTPCGTGDEESCGGIKDNVAFCFEIGAHDP